MVDELGTAPTKDTLQGMIVPVALGGVDRPTLSGAGPCDIFFHRSAKKRVHTAVANGSCREKKYAVNATERWVFTLVPVNGKYMILTGRFRVQW